MFTSMSMLNKEDTQIFWDKVEILDNVMKAAMD